DGGCGGGVRGRGEFVEWWGGFDDAYGPRRKPVEGAVGEGRDVLFDVDWQGARKLRESAKEDVVAVFILPPTAGELEKRLQVRAEDSNETVRRRMQGASNEIQHWDEYDYVVINYDVDRSLAALHAILAAERLRRSRLTGLKDFIQNLLTEL